MDRVDENLFLGDVKSANDEKRLRDCKISHVLTVDIFPIPKIAQCSNIEYRFIKANDRAEENLLQHFDDSFKFLDDAIRSRNGFVLVHW